MTRAALGGVVLGLVPALLPAAPPPLAPFPRFTSFSFKATRSGLPVTGSFRVEFMEDPLEPSKRYLLTLKGMSGMGMRSEEVLFTAVSKSTFALQYATVMPFEGAPPDKFTSQLTLESCRSVMAGAQRFCFVFREAKSAVMQTEFFTPYEGMDFLSSMLVASRMASHGPQQQGFNFIERQVSTQVELVLEPRIKLDTALGALETTPVVARKPGGDQALYRIFVAKAPRGPFVAKLSFQSEESSLEAAAQAPIW